MRRIRLAALGLMLGAAAFAADASGHWTAEMQTPNGQTHEITMNLKEDGAKLTGTVSGRGGDTEITDGKVDGDNISFSIVREMNGNQMKMNYVGTIAGDQIKFKMSREGGEGRSMEFTAKRAAN